MEGPTTSSIGRRRWWNNPRSTGCLARAGADALCEAAALKIQVADAEKRASEIVVQASSGAHKLVEDARLAALEFQEKQMQQAKAEAEALVAKARADIKREREVMLAELRSEVASLVVRTTAKVAGKVLTDDDQRRLTEEANRELAA
jgi:F-type H+-transporting ATPase subunit b